VADEKKAIPDVGLGTTGLIRYGGYVGEEFLRELQGLRWRRVIRQMVDNDPIIGAFLFAIEMTVRQAKYEFNSFSDKAVHKADAGFVEECLSDMESTWPDTLSEILSFLPWGWCVCEQVFKERKGDEPGTYTPPTGKPRKLPASQYNDGQIGWHKWSIRAQETLQEWVWDEDSGDVVAMIQNAPPRFQQVTIPLDKCLHFRTTSRKRNPEGRAIIRNAYTAWYFRRRIEQIEAIGIERDLAGYPVAKIPASDMADADKFAAWKNIVTNIRRDELEGAVIPSDRDEHGNPLWELLLMSTGGTRQFDTNKIILRYNDDITRSVLADFLMIGHESVGSFALSADKSDLFRNALKGYLDAIAAVINEKAIPDLFRLNGKPTHELPMLAFGDVRKIDLAVLGKYFSDLGAGGMMTFPTQDGKLESALIEVAGVGVTPTPESFMELAAQDAADKKAQQDAMAEAAKAKASQPPQQTPQKSDNGK
jgi:hypothetical protein